MDYLPEVILERDKERRRLSSHCTTQAMRDAVAAQKHLALRGVPSLGHCGVAPRLCAAVGTPTSSRLALTSNLGLQIVNFILWHPLREIGLSFSFLTRIPVKVPGKYAKGVFASGEVGDPAFFVLVGYAVGLAYLALLRFTQFIHLSGLLSVIIVMAVVYYFFELFHFDGLLDTFDGFLCQKEKNERIEIMKKGNIGPFALFYGVLFILAHFYLINQLASRPILIFVAGPISRWSMVLLLAISSPAKNEGLAASFYPLSSRSFLWAGIFLLPVIILAPVFTAVALVSVIAITLVVNLTARRLISGVTGDILGAGCLIAEVCSLFFLNMILKL